MTDFLDGRLVIESLSPERDSAGRFRSEDARGHLALILADANVEYVEFAEFAAAGVARGNHYHQHYIEELYVITGSIQMKAKALDGGDPVTVRLEAGSMTTIHPGIAHVFEALGPAAAISMGKRSNPFTDRHAYTAF